MKKYIWAPMLAYPYIMLANNPINCKNALVLSSTFPEKVKLYCSQKKREQSLIFQNSTSSDPKFKSYQKIVSKDESKYNAQKDCNDFAKTNGLPIRSCQEILTITTPLKNGRYESTSYFAFDYAEQISVSIKLDTNTYLKIQEYTRNKKGNISKIINDIVKDRFEKDKFFNK